MAIIHTHSFVAVGFISLCWCWGDAAVSPREFFSVRWRPWLAFFSASAISALPFVLKLNLFAGGDARGVQWFPGWYARKLGGNFVWFWWKNWGLTLLCAFLGAGLWLYNQKEKKEKLRWAGILFPFFALFAASNLFLFHPWIWDNTKFLIWASVAFSGFAGYFLYVLAFGVGENPPAFPGLRRGLALALFSLMVASGAVDAYRLQIPSLNTHQMYSNEDLSLAQWVFDHTDPHSVWLTGPYHNNFLFNLTGRKTVMVYEGWLWTHGYDYANIRAAVLDMLSMPERRDLYAQYGVDFILVGPVEKEHWEADIERLRKNFPVVKQTDSYTILSTGKSRLIKEEPVPLPAGSKVKADRELGADYYLRPGFRKTTYDNAQFAGEGKSEITLTDIDFRYDADQPRPFVSPCSMEWDGYLKVMESGEYTLTLESDDGSWLFLGDALAVENGGVHGLRRKSNTFGLEKGYHKIKIRYFDSTGGAVFQVKWKRPGAVEEMVSSDYFTHDHRAKDKRRKFLLF